MRRLAFLFGASVLAGCFDPDAGGDGSAGQTTMATDDPTTTMLSSSTSPTSSATAMTESTGEDTSRSEGSLDDSSSSSSSSGTSSTSDASDTEAGPCVVDGMVSETEECDDGNEAEGDGCSDCVIEEGFGCGDEPSQCFPACHPIPQNCRLGDGCYPLDPVFACVPEGSGQQYDACESINGCVPGFACISVDVVPGCEGPFAGCCSPICNLLDPECPDELACAAFYAKGEAPEGLEDVGVCAG